MPANASATIYSSIKVFVPIIVIGSHIGRFKRDGTTGIVEMFADEKNTVDT